MSKLMKIVTVVRSHEWWEYKLPPLLALGYATALNSCFPLYRVAPWLLFLLFSIMIGAIYVSVINDITDIEEDLASGKANRIATVNPRYRWLIPVLCIISGLFITFLLWGDSLSVVLYLLPWISFSLYSFEPFRLKRRGILGVFADASGSHLFISLLFVSSTSHFTGQSVDWILFTAVGIWAFSYGLRGILWHQFYDRENDIKVNLNTFASNIEPTSFKNKTAIILTIELLALVVMLIRIQEPLTIVFLVIYLILSLLRNKKFGYKTVAIMTPSNQPFEIFMMEYYQLFLPVSLLIAASIINPYSLIVLIVHLLLFNQKLQIALADIKRLITNSKEVEV